MSATIGDVPGRPIRAAGTGDLKLLEIAYTVGAGGDPAAGTLLLKTDVNLTLAKNAAAGQYDLTFPAMPPGAYAFLSVFIVSATVECNSQALVVGFSEATGTASIIARTATTGAAVNLTSGDRIHVQIWASSQAQV